MENSADSERKSFYNFFVCKMSYVVIKMYILISSELQQTGEHIQYFVIVASKHTESNKLCSKPSFNNFMLLIF